MNIQEEIDILDIIIFYPFHPFCYI